MTRLGGAVDPVTARPVTVIPIPGLPRVGRGDDIPFLLLEATREMGERFRDSDIVVITQKIVSKAEGRIVELAAVKPGGRAIRLAEELGKDPRLVETILRESVRVLRVGHGVVITETKQGLVCANSGVDQSNVEQGYVSLLPLDPDASARAIRKELERRTGKTLAVIITDTFGRPWREGQVDIAVGCSGITPLHSLAGRVDSYGYRLRVTEPAIVDEVAAASELVMRKLAMVPAVIVRGMTYSRSEKGVRSMIRPKELDLFR